MSTFGKKEIVNCIKTETNCTNKVAVSCFDLIFNSVIEALKRGDEVALPGFKLEVVDREACERRNPKTGEKVQVEAKKTVKVKALKLLKDALNG